MSGCVNSGYLPKLHRFLNNIKCSGKYIPGMIMPGSPKIINFMLAFWKRSDDDGKHPIWTPERRYRSFMTSWSKNL